jgi:transcriptional regulator with XRE-family HTH domain
MARKSKLDFSDIANVRKKQNLNQTEFWTRYGVTQSGGSRYESGRNIPKPLAILLWLHRSGKTERQGPGGRLRSKLPRAFRPCSVRTGQANGLNG